MKTKIGKKILFGMIFVWGFLSVCVMAGEDIPGQPMSELQFYGSKLLAAASLGLCYLAGRKLNRMGLLPEVKEEEPEEEWED